MSFSLFKKKPDTFDYEASRSCKACDTIFQGRYCNKCGEKVIEPNERSILHFLESLLNAFTFLDGKFIRTLMLLITKPGKLSRNIADGVRVPYMKMVSLFFVANFFYFFFFVWDSFNSSLYTQMNLLGYNNQATRMVNERLVKDNISLEDFRTKYQAQSTNLSKLLLVVLAILFTLVLMVINFSRKVYFFDHLLFSLEFFSFHILINLVILSNLLVILIKGASQVGIDTRFLMTDEYFSLIAGAIIAYFLFFGQINFYNQKWYWGGLRVVALVFLLKEVVGVYRHLLFYLTMWTV